MYDYRCERCSTQFEVRQSFSDDALTVCPAEVAPTECVAPGEGPVKKVFSGVAISFKGDGFYKNDHGANARGRRKERESDSTKDSSSSKDSSTKDSSTKDSSTKDSSTKDSSTKDSSTKDSSSSGASSDARRAKAGAGTSTPTS